MARRVNIFYGYPSRPPFIGESIANAIEKLKAHQEIRQNSVRFRPWPTIRVSGKILAREVMNNIDRAEVFACDLTYPNDNVSFELGYAIGRYKRIFISLDSTIEESQRRFRRHYFSSLSLGYSSYSNHDELARRILEEKPWQDARENVLDPRYRRSFARPELPTLFYLKPPINTSSVLKTVDALEASKFGQSHVIDDPLDNPSAQLEWYAQQLMIADAVMIHLLSEEHVQWEVHNTKASFIAGLACGLNRPLLMLGHAPYESPVDYDHLLQTHDTAEACGNVATQWLKDIGDSLPRRRPRRSRKTAHANLELRNISLGQHVAEYESNELENYFVETGPFFAAIQGPTTILTGRRGTGKTAILYAIKAELERDRRNHVTVLKPVAYELEGLIRVLQETRQISERGFLIESLWKYLIYSEIARSVQESLSNRSIYQSPTKAEEAFLSYCETHADKIGAPFSLRIDQAVQSLYGIGQETNTREQRARISERLHETQLRSLRQHLGGVLSNQGRLAVLIDNLDGPWATDDHVTEMSELIRGLLNVVQDIPRDLGRATHGLEPIDTTVAVLLRSDIFASIKARIPEQDKLPIEQVLWDDKDLLRRVLVQRLMQNAPLGMNESAVWEHVFPQQVEGSSTADFIFETVLPRPRDMIHMVKVAISTALTRRHEKVLAEDLMFARDKYSKFAFDSVLAEDDPQRLKLEAVLFEFAGAKRTVSLPEIMERMSKADVSGDDAEWYLNLLCDIGFLGISTSSGFRYAAEEGERSRLREIAKRRAAQSGSQEVYQINSAFYYELQIK